MYFYRDDGVSRHWVLSRKGDKNHVNGYLVSSLWYGVSRGVGTGHTVTTSSVRNHKILGETFCINTYSSTRGEGRLVSRRDPSDVPLSSGSEEIPSTLREGK